MKINGQDIHGNRQKGYATLGRAWKTGDVLEVNFVMSSFLVEADPRVDSVRGCVAIQRGPLVYCLEGQDQQPEVNVLDIQIDQSKPLSSHWQGDLLGGVMTVKATGYQTDRSDWHELYRPLISRDENQSSEQKVKLTAIPYYVWGNRGLKSMRVWIPYL